MKSTYLVSLGLSAAMAMAVGACADEAAAPAMPEGEITARLTVTVSREGAQDPSSRLTHSENAAGLKAEWELGDHLLFCYDTNDAGAVASTLTLESIDASDASVATFTGDVTIPASALAGGNTTLTRAAIAYLGKTAANAPRAIATSTTIDISTQDGRFDAMAWNDVMALRGLAVSVTPKGNNQYAATVADGSIIPLGQTENRKLAFAHFTTNLAGGSTVTITGNTYNAITLNISGSDTRTEGPITVTTWGPNAVRQPILASRITVPDGPGDQTGDAGTGGDDDDDDFVSGSGSASVTVHPVTHMFVALIPTDDAQPINFEAVEPDGTRLTYTLDARELTAGHFYRPDWDDTKTEAENLNKGIFLKFEEVKDPEPSPADDTVGPTITIDGKNYRFTRGNLYYNSTTQTWGIFERQTDFLGATPAANSNITQWDLFAWGVTGREQSQAFSYFSTSGNDFPFKSNSITNLFEAERMYEWGKAYMVAGRASDDNRDYRTPRSEDFYKVFEKGFVQGATITVDGKAVKGTIVIPGNFSDLQAVKDFIREKTGRESAVLSTMGDLGIWGVQTGNASTSYPAQYWHNPNGDIFNFDNIKLTSYDELKKLNDALFFPAAGHMVVSGRVYSGEGYYWSCGGNGTNATHLIFRNKTGFTYKSSSGRYLQNAVRLLVEVTE